MLHLVVLLQVAADDASKAAGQSVAPANIDRWVAILGVILAVAAIVFAYFHARTIREVLGKAKAHADRLSEINESLSTRYVGEFPRFFPKIVEVMGKATQDIVILCDFPAYGSFTDRKCWTRYKHAIEEKLLDGIKIQMTCFSDGLRRSTVDNQFFDAQQWDNWKADHRNSELLEELRKWHKGSPTVGALSKEQFIQLLADEEHDALTQTFQGADIKEIDDYVPLHFWIADQAYAVFAITSSSNKEYGFFTIDRQIIASLKQMRDYYDSQH